MKGSRSLRSILALTATAIVAFPLLGFGDQGIDEIAAREAATLPAESPAFLRSSETSSAARVKYEYALLPFSEGNFDSKKDFEQWLDGLGAKGWRSAFHFAPFEQRLFMRQKGGPKLVVDYAIKAQRISPLTHNYKKWVPEYDKLGGQGKFVVWLFRDKGKTFAVYEIATSDGVLQTLSWEDEPAGENQPRDPDKFMDAVNRLAAQAHVSNTVGISKNQANYASIGAGETTPGKVLSVEVRFEETKISISAKKLKKLINKHAKDGFIISDSQLADNTGALFITVFARVTVNGEFERSTCKLQKIPIFGLESMVKKMNKKGKKGFEKVFQTVSGGGTSFHFVMCKAK